MNIALKYSPIEEYVSCILYKCNIMVSLDFDIVYRDHMEFYLQGGCTEDGENLYAKIILRSKKEKDISQKIWCTYDWNKYDFSKEIILKLNGRSLNDCCINIQLKKAAGFGEKSKLIYNKRQNHKKIFSDAVLGEINIGPDSTGHGFQHWTEMTDNPESRIFKWHTTLSSP